jgi:hypothetical protein
MRLNLRLAKLLVLVLFLFAWGNSVAFAKPLSPELVQLLPERIGEFQRSQDISPLEAVSALELGGSTEYRSSRGDRLSVELYRFQQDAEAYSWLTIIARASREQNPSEKIEISGKHGTSSFEDSSQIAFFKGRYYVRVSSSNGRSGKNLDELASSFAEQLDKGEGEIPVLVKHLPNWEEAQKRAVFTSRFRHLEHLGLFQPVLSALNSGGGADPLSPGADADAVVANYGTTKVLIVEFNTPQLAAENDQLIISRIQQLWKLGQPAPTAYRRVGNYSVFVFDAPDEQTAKQLIDQVKYEQVVQWLGENPNILREAERRYVETTLGVFLAVVKASGVAALACFAVGGLLGALLFTRRRAQQRTVEAFSDAGGMLRLNIDELTPQTDPAKLLSERN